MQSSVVDYNQVLYNNQVLSYETLNFIVHKTTNGNDGKVLKYRISQQWNKLTNKLTVP